MYERITEHLRQHVQLAPRELDVFLATFAVATYGKNAHLLQAGQICQYTCFVNRGLLRLYDIDEKGLEKNALFAPEGWWVSDLYSFHRRRPGNLFLQALEETEVLQLTKPALEAVLLEVPRLERYWRILHINAFVAQQERVVYMMDKPAEERYREFIRKYPDAELRIAQKHIASYLGIAPESLSRMKARLKT
ncbi:MAG: Crp/Fnr family transcriptional regulator [Lewinella sp.]|nr:Crp/Fnr family transcriptional regulator [Lewinella sp.]